MAEGELMTLSDAAVWLDPSGTLKASSLRTEAERGRLQLIKIAGKHFVTENALKEMVERCQLHKNHQDFGSESVKVERPFGSSKMAASNTSQAAAKQTAQALKMRLPNTSLQSGRHQTRHKTT